MFCSLKIFFLFFFLWNSRTWKSNSQQKLNVIRYFRNQRLNLFMQIPKFRKVGINRQNSFLFYFIFPWGIHNIWPILLGIWDELLYFTSHQRELAQKFYIYCMQEIKILKHCKKFILNSYKGMSYVKNYRIFFVNEWKIWLIFLTPWPFRI